MICSLVGQHSLQKLHSDWPVEPRDVPLAVFSLRKMVLEVELGNFFDHVVVSVLDHALVAPGDFVRIHFVLIVLVARCEPVRVV